MAAKVKPSNKSFPAILVAVAVVGVVAIGYMVSRPAKVLTLPTAPILKAQGILKGDTAALVQVIEFADFECPGCGQFATVTEPDVMQRLVASGEVAFRFMDYPLTEIHPNALAAHSAAACANEQGKFWEMHDRIFLNQHRWNSRATRKPKGVLEELAQGVGLDMGPWNECYDSGRMLEQIAANREEGNRLGVGSTPTFIINDRVIADVLTYDEFHEAVTLAKIARMASMSEATGKKVTSPTKR